MTSVASEEILKEKIIEDREANGKWDNIQKGFTKDRMYRVNLLSVFNKITDFLNKRFVIHLIYICAAYDTALHRKQGIRRRVVKWIRDCLMDRWQQVALKEAASNCWKFTCRNSQKSVFQSIMFLTFRHEEKRYEIYSFH